MDLLRKTADRWNPSSSSPQAIYAFSWPIVVLLLLANIAFVFGGFYLAFLKEEAEFFGRLVGLFCIAFFGLTFATMIGDLFIRGPVLIIDAQGILDKRMSARRIPWQEVRNAYVSKVRYSKFISLDLANPDPYLPSPLTFRGLMSRLNPMARFTKMTIPTLPLTGTAEEILEAIERNRAQASEESSSRR